MFGLDLGDAFDDALDAVARVVPKLLAFLAILAVGWIIALALRKICDAVLRRVGFDRAVERGGIGRALAGSRYDASDIVARLIYYAVLLVTLQMAFGVWGPNPVSDLIRDLVAWLPQAAIAIVIVVVAASIARAVRDIVGAALGALSYGPLLAATASYVVLGLGVIAASGQMGVAVAVTMPVLIAVLATVGGILVVGAGGGLIRPMQQRWERLLSRVEDRSRQVAEHAGAYAAGRDDTRRRYSGATATATAGGAGRDATMTAAGMNTAGMTTAGMSTGDPPTATGTTDWPAIDDTVARRITG